MGFLWTAHLRQGWWLVLCPQASVSLRRSVHFIKKVRHTRPRCNVRQVWTMRSRAGQTELFRPVTHKHEACGVRVFGGHLSAIRPDRPSQFRGSYVFLAVVSTAPSECGSTA